VVADMALNDPPVLNDPAVLNALLSVQEHDTAITALRHRRSHLLESAQKTAAEQRGVSLLAQRNDVEAQLSSVTARQEALEHTIAELDAKIADLDHRLYGGTVTSPKELQALEADIASVRAHRSTQEDLELEILVDREPLDAQRATVERDLATLGDEISTLIAAIEGLQAEIDTEIEGHGTARAEAAATVDAALLGTYESVRARNNGIGIARLEHGTCMACRLKLPAVELDRLRRAGSGDVARCPECSAILVIG
jgi:uncharacterized protein